MTTDQESGHLELCGGLRTPQKYGLSSGSCESYDSLMKLDRARELAGDKLERLARDSTETVSFWREATDVLRGVIPFDFHPCWFTVDPSTMLITSHVNDGLGYTPKEIATAWYAEGDVNSPADLAALRRGATTVKAATGGDVVSSWRWRNLLEPNGFDDSLDAVFRKGGTIWGAVNLLHNGDSRPYNSEDVRFISRLSSVFAEGTQLGQLRAKPATTLDGGGSAVLIRRAGTTVSPSTPGPASRPDPKPTSSTPQYGKHGNGVPSSISPSKANLPP